MTPDYERLLIPQESIPPGAGEDAFPQHIDRKCCPYKSCGNADLYRSFEYDRYTGQRVYGYRRGSNDDWYFGPYDDLDDLAVAMDRRDQWPVDVEALDALFERHRQGVYEEDEED